MAEQDAERARLESPTRGTRRGGPGVRTCPSAPGAPSGRTTATTAPRGTTSRTTTPAPGSSGGTRTGWPASATSGRRSASRSRSGTARTRSSRSGSSGWPVPRATTARTPRSTGGTSTPRRPTRTCAGATTTRRSRFPYGDIVRTNAARGRERAGVRARRHRHLRRGPVLGGHRRLRQGVADRHVRAGHDREPGPEAATLHVLPTLWFRNTWAWGLPGWDEVPQIHGYDDGHAGGQAPHPRPDRAGRRAGGDGVSPRRWCATTSPTPSACGGWATGRRTRRTASTTTLWTVKPTVNPDRVGTKAALHYTVDVPAGGTKTLRLRLARVGDAGRRVVARGGGAQPRHARPGQGVHDGDGRPQAGGRRVLRRGDPAGASADEAMVLRQAVAGLMWGKQFYHYDVARWLKGDPH